jgi:hypothetical protein
LEQLALPEARDTLEPKPVGGGMQIWRVFWFIFVMVPLTIAWAFSVFDIFHRRDLSGLGKALWFGVVILLPWLGTFLYLIFRPRETSEEEIRAQEAARRAYDKSLAADQIAKLSALHTQGELNDQEYAAAKAHLLMTMAGPPSPGTAAPTH